MGKPTLGPATPKKRIWWRWLLGAVLLILGLLMFGMMYPDKLPQPTGEKVSPIGTALSNCSRSFVPNYGREPYYQGEIFDSHFHLPNAPGIKSFFIKQPTLGEGKEVTLNELLCLFEKEKSRGAIAFYMPIKTKDGSLSQAPEINGYTDKLNLFISPVMNNADQIDKILTGNPGLFKGIGEMQFYEFTKYFKPIDGAWAKSIYKVADKHKLIVMFHPGFGQIEQVEKILSDYSNVTFILHGRETQREIEELLAKHPNLYYSVDGATLYAMRGKFVLGKKDSYLKKFGEEFNSMLNEGINTFKRVLEKYPDRFMLGTDRGAAWHYDEDAAAAFEEFSRAFIARLNPSVQENFAYKNAEKLLGQ